ncbi:hypothetical protein HJC23_003631 [Cyclotella cryptica]|uniref:Uncharacterized protein n=1 Tax=Cyclotella cryptica TaxID=29204 RepID=A0ABD3QIZ3_9STRA
MSFITKLVNPAFYQQQYASLARSMTAYYSPLFQSGRGYENVCAVDDVSTIMGHKKERAVSLHVFTWLDIRQTVSLHSDPTSCLGPIRFLLSVKPLWHMMIATSVIMYTQNYVFNKGPKIQAGRQEQKKALEEYYANHGISHHH